MRLYPSKLRTTLIFLFNAIIVIALFMLTMWNVFFIEPWGFLQWILIASFVLISVASYIFIIKSFYYTIQNKFFTVRKFNKEMVYNFNEILYIDENYSSKKGTIFLVTTKGDTRYIVHDKERKLYQALLKNCKNLVDKQEVARRFPNLIKELK